MKIQYELSLNYLSWGCYFLNACVLNSKILLWDLNPKINKTKNTIAVDHTKKIPRIHIQRFFSILFQLETIKYHLCCNEVREMIYGKH